MKNNPNIFKIGVNPITKTTKEDSGFAFFIYLKIHIICIKAGTRYRNNQIISSTPHPTQAILCYRGHK